MAIRLSTELGNRILNADGMKSILDNGFIAIYTGSQPASADLAATGSLLAVIYSDGITASAGLTFDAPVANLLSKAAAEVWSGTTLLTGTAGWFRYYEFNTDVPTSLTEGAKDDSVSLDNSRIDGSIGISGADLNISSTTFTAGALQTLSTFNITMPLA